MFEEYQKASVNILHVFVVSKTNLLIYLQFTNFKTSKSGLSMQNCQWHDTKNKFLRSSRTLYIVFEPYLTRKQNWLSSWNHQRINIWLTNPNTSPLIIRSNSKYVNQNADVQSWHHSIVTKVSRNFYEFILLI